MLLLIFPHQRDRKKLVSTIFRHFLRQIASEKQTNYRMDLTADGNHFLKSLSDFPYRINYTYQCLCLFFLSNFPGPMFYSLPYVYFRLSFGRVKHQKIFLNR
jgi:hypothetical protein